VTTQTFIQPDFRQDSTIDNGINAVVAGRDNLRKVLR